MWKKMKLEVKIICPTALTEFKIATICMAVVFLVPVHVGAQDNTLQKMKQENAGLEQKIAALVADTAVLSRKIADAGLRMLRLDAETDSLDRRIRQMSDSISSGFLDNLRRKADSLEKVASGLQDRSEELDSIARQRTAALARIASRMDSLTPFMRIMNENRKSRNLAVLQKKYSLMTEEELTGIILTVDDFSETDGFQDYKLKVETAFANHRLYVEAFRALNSPYDSCRVQELRTRLETVLSPKKDESILTDEHFAEMDSMNIRLSRFYVGVLELKAIVAKINGNGQIKAYRAKDDRKACIDVAEKILFSQDAMSVFVRQRYFEMIPYLNELLKAYWSELQDNPIDVPTKTEKIIVQMTD